MFLIDHPLFLLSDDGSLVFKSMRIRADLLIVLRCLPTSCLALQVMAAMQMIAAGSGTLAVLHFGLSKLFAETEMWYRQIGHALIL